MTKRYTYLFILSFFSVALFSFAHPLYLSVCQINHNEKNQSLEIAVKVFTEDVDMAMDKQGVGNLFLGEEKESEEADRYISAYLKKQIKISVNGQPFEFTYLGKEVEMDVTWCYVEIEGIETVEHLSITNKLFFELFDPQRNLVHVRVGKDEKSIMLYKDKETDVLEF